MYRRPRSPAYHPFDPPGSLTPLASHDAKGFLFQNSRKESVTMLPAVVLVPVIEAVATAITTIAVQKLLDASPRR